jgi:hypothetical protein
MAESFAHRWGRIIGNLLEDSLRKSLQAVADRHSLYFDAKGSRPARPGKKVTWQDRLGNSHDLDYVLERGGTDAVRGLPAAFIETAWRRYTKHSRNKAQEIQGAILALAETYGHLRPFLGIVVAGVFTQGSLNQLRTSGFSVAYVPYQTINRAFAAVGIDSAFREDTAEAEFRDKVRKYEALSAREIARVQGRLLKPPSTKNGGPNREDQSITQFLAALDSSLARGVQGVAVVVLHGSPQQLASVQEAIAYLQEYAETRPSVAPAVKYAVDVRYNNGDVIHGVFQEKTEAIQFLRSFA